MVLFLLLGLAALVLLLGAAQGFSKAQITTIKSLLAWVAALAGLSLGTLLLLTGRGAAALSALVMFGPLVWSWWREGNAAPGARPQAGPRQSQVPRGPAMTRAEALDVLGLKPGASEAEIRAAYVRLMRAAHPDSGGSDWLATRVNQARDVLLGH
jgi:DnaJ homolog subfamily C member 19